MKTQIEGPGKRMAIWFQGCKILCNNCSNQEMLDLKPKLFIPVELLIDQILISKDKYDIEGITLLGGDPFLQPDALRRIVYAMKKNNLSVIVFTGYIYSNLLKEYKDILFNIDILIDGPFIAQKLDVKRRLIGSTNQKVWYLTERYKGNDYFEKPHSEVEIEIYKNRIFINGDGTSLDDESGKFIFKIEK